MPTVHLKRSPEPHRSLKSAILHSPGASDLHHPTGGGVLGVQTVAIFQDQPVLPPGTA